MIKKATTKQEYGYCAAIRAIVFLEEQNCEGYIKVEYDEHEDSSTDFILLFEGEPVATARYRPFGNETAKIERIAVLKNYRGKGLGRNIVEHVTQKIRNEGIFKKIIMSAQDYALPFYKKLGYEVTGNGYLETGIPHHKIEMNIEVKSE